MSEDELINWIKYVQNRYVWSNTERQWADHQSENATLVTLKWDAYKTRTYGHIDGNYSNETYRLDNYLHSLKYTNVVPILFFTTQYNNKEVIFPSDSIMPS